MGTPTTEQQRHVAPGGTTRMLVGFACGLLAGVLVALVLPREDGPRRRSLVVADAIGAVHDAVREAVDGERPSGGR